MTGSYKDMWIWLPLYAEYRALIPEAATTIWEIKQVCDEGGGAVSDKTGAAALAVTSTSGSVGFILYLMVRTLHARGSRKVKQPRAEGIRNLQADRWGQV
jgi:hypothetical protein